MAFSSHRSINCKSPPRIGGCHFLLCQITNIKDIAGQSASGTCTGNDETETRISNYCTDNNEIGIDDTDTGTDDTGTDTDGIDIGTDYILLTLVLTVLIH